jgi:hypothetical protein
MGVSICWRGFDSTKWRWNSRGYRPWAVYVTTVTKNLPGCPQSHTLVSQTGQPSAIHFKSSPTNPPFTGPPAIGSNTDWHTDSIVKLNKYTLYIVCMIEKLYCTESVFFFSSVSTRAVGNTPLGTGDSCQDKSGWGLKLHKTYMTKMCGSLTLIAHEPLWRSP